MDYFIPNWIDYCRKEEGVQAYYFSGTDSDADDLISSFPDNFVVRTTTDSHGNKISKLCMQDSTTEICILKPNTWIIRDSCGRFYTYDKQFFELAFIKPENKREDVEIFAKEYYEIEQNKSTRFNSIEEYIKWDDLEEKEKAKRILDMANFVKKFTVFRR